MRRASLPGVLIGGTSAHRFPDREPLDRRDGVETSPSGACRGGSGGRNSPAPSYSPSPGGLRGQPGACRPAAREPLKDRCATQAPSPECGLVLLSGGSRSDAAESSRNSRQPHIRRLPLVAVHPRERALVGRLELLECSNDACLGVGGREGAAQLARDALDRARERLVGCLGLVAPVVAEV